MSMRQYEWCELVFSSAEPKGSFVQIPLHAAIEKDGRTWNVVDVALPCREYMAVLALESEK